MSLKPVPFQKYDEMGAYHWTECDRNSRQYNPPLEARYGVLANRVSVGRRVLDVGCEDGYLMSLVSPLSNQVVGIDAQPLALVLAAQKLRRFGNCAVTRASFYEMPFSDGYFDVVLLADVIEHLEEPELCLKEISRVLSPNGTLMVTTPRRLLNRPLGYGHIKEFTGAELAACLGQYFVRVTLTFFWPMSWYGAYQTKIGWRLIRVFARWLYNPFLREGEAEQRHGQILAVCEQQRW